MINYTEVVEYATANKDTVTLAAIGIVIAVYLAVKYVQYVGLEKIRKDVYDLFSDAEKGFQHGENTEKFNYVINLAKATIPSPYNLFITENLLRKVVQAWFNLCKDLLDDGNYNQSSTTKEEENPQV